ncbi:S66 peptidase family protein [Trueperella sp. LYQ143]|uniref:S66 family peptidase n=1 Tax=Trueperella sp. LYQ143 TaxID=3391059 RepID=UPI0039838492
MGEVLASSCGRVTTQKDKRIAVLSPAMAGPAYGLRVHEQAVRRLQEITGCEVVEFPTTRMLQAPAAQRAHDVNMAFADPAITAIMTSVGGSDQITILPYLDAQIIQENPKPFFGYSDNTHLLNWLWRHGIPSIYGGSTQVQIGPGPQVDSWHEQCLRSALAGVDLVLENPGESEDHGHDWADPRALTEYGVRQQVGPWQWAGSSRPIRARTWGGCVQVLQEIFLADHAPVDAELDGAILLLEFSDDLMEPLAFGYFLRALGERGLLERFSGVMLARVPATTLDYQPTLAEQERYRRAMDEVLVGACQRYAPDAVICLGVPFGHTRPQLLLPYGGEVTLDPRAQQVCAHYRR